MCKECVIKTLIQLLLSSGLFMSTVLSRYQCLNCSQSICLFPLCVISDPQFSSSIVSEWYYGHLMRPAQFSICAHLCFPTSPFIVMLNELQTVPMPISISRLVWLSLLSCCQLHIAYRIHAFAFSIRADAVACIFSRHFRDFPDKCLPHYSVHCMLDMYVFVYSAQGIYQR